MVFLPKESASRLACQEEIERAVRTEHQVVLGWRDVPVDHALPMSPTVRTREPVIRQIFIGRGPDIMVTDALERKLYVIRRSAANAIQALGLKHSKEFYQPSMSARTIVYKGLLLATRSASTTPTSRIRVAFRRWRWFTSVSRPTPSRPGSWRTRSG
jgi:glutamate synthase (NADPH/NADH) large chain